MVGSEGRLDHLMDDSGDDAGMEPQSSGVSCSICLDLISDNGGRSRAKLQCGHEFHLDCIGSAFNIKGAMQCPNCRKVEKGQWLYANCFSRSVPEFSMDDWIPDDDPYDLSYSEMPIRVHWCPFGELARIHTSFEEVDFPSTAYHDLREHHAMLAEHTAASSVAHSYVAYFGPIPHASSRSSDNVDDRNFNHPWNGLSGHNEIFNPHTYPAISIQHHSWGRHSPPFSQFGSHINSADPASVPAATLRSTHSDSDAITRSRSFPHPPLFAHGSGPAAGSSFVSSTVPGHAGSSGRTHEIQVSHAFHHQHQLSNSPGMPSPITPAIRRFDGPGGLQPVVPAPPQPDRNGSFHIFPPQSSSVQNLHEAQNPLPNRFHAWEREHSSHFPTVSSDRDSDWSFHHTAGGSRSVNISNSLWPRHWS